MTWIVAEVGCKECGHQGGELLNIIGVHDSEDAALADAREQTPDDGWEPEPREGEVYRGSDWSVFVLPVVVEPVSP